MWEKRKLPAIVCLCLLLMLAGCATGQVKSSTVDTPFHDRIVAVGDVHGNYDGLVSVLRETALIDDTNRWIGGSTLLVQVGDLLDRDVHHREIMDLMM